MDPDDIVISGMSGRFPGCDNINELHEALMNGVDLVSDNHGRWAKDFFGLSNRGGIMNDIENFDNEFFGVPPRLSDGLDPRTRLLMEATFESFIDAGINPGDFRGSRTGVFVGMTTSRGNDSVFENKVNFTRIGRSMAMSSGMVSFMFDLRGPSYALDTACSSSLYAFCQAFRSIRSGECDAAFVCGATVILDPYDSLEYKTMNILSPTGRCQFLDEERDGFAKSESVVVVFLQKRKDSKRIYATVKGCGTNTDGFKIEGVTKPSSEMQGALMENIYKEFNINPHEITYIEAHGTGTKIGDFEEIVGIENILCQNRKEPLLIGSVKTNIGHTEMSSGLTSILKVLSSMEREVIPPIIHLKNIAEEISPVIEGKIKPVTEPTKWKDGLMGVNSFGVGGTNAHVVLEANSKRKVDCSTKIYKNRLIFLAGRNEKGLNNMVNFVNENKNNEGLVFMLDNLFEKPVRMYHHKAFMLLDDEYNNYQSAIVNEGDKEVWFIYSGIGSQWPHMAKDLMKMSYFEKYMKECAEPLRPFNIDLIEVVTNYDQEKFKDVTNCFISIVAISICLTDVLKMVGIEPHGVIGHSVGEICCAYADNVITKSQAMLIAHARGLALKEASTIEGTLAVIGLTIDAASEKLPEDIFIACYNSIDNLTISGPSASVFEFVKQLKSEGIFAEIIQGANVAYHSKYIAEAGNILERLLNDVIEESKPISKRWISTSVTKNKRDESEMLENDTDEIIMHSPKYHKNNLVGSVNLVNAMSQVPKDAIVIEISPKGLLQTIIRKNLGNESRITSLSSDTALDNLHFLLSSIGRLYLFGLYPKLSKLYDAKGQFPVVRGTPSLAPLVEWERTMKCKVPYYAPEKSFGECISVDLSDPNMKYLEGHVVEGKTIFPVMGYAYLAWEIFARLHKKSVSEFPVIIENLKIRRLTLLPKDNAVHFKVNILNSDGSFEINEGGTAVCNGKIRSSVDIEKSFTDNIPVKKTKEDIVMNQEDIYYKLNRLGFHYKNHFQGILESKQNAGIVKWSDYWIPFLDTMIHYIAVVNKEKSLHLPESIGKIIIDPENHLKLATENNNQILLKYEKETNIIQCGKVEIRDLQLIQLPERKSYVIPKLETYQFIPYICTEVFTLYDCINMVLQIVVENFDEFTDLKILELHEENVEKKEATDSSPTEKKIASELSTTLKCVIEEEMLLRTQHDKQVISNSIKNINQYHLIVLDVDEEIPEDFSNGFCFMKENKLIDDSKLENKGFLTIAKYCTEKQNYLLIRKKKSSSGACIIIKIGYEKFQWVEELKMRMAKTELSKIYILNDRKEENGIMGLFNCLRYEDNGRKVRMISLVDKEAMDFSFKEKFYSTQIKKDLSVNIFKNGSWGSYRYMPYRKMGTRMSDKCHLEVIVPGDMSQIKMVENFPRSDDEFEPIHVYYAGVNFKDLLIANGMLRLPGFNQNSFDIGFEFSGRKSNGQRVFGITRSHAFATIIDEAPICWPVPDSWTLEEAASVPIVYLTLYYTFFQEVNLESGSSILIHSASGGIGMAAIQIALNLNCTIFATVGSEVKKKQVMEEFPQLKEDHIFSSRDDTFEIMIRRITRGQGVNCILNSLVGDLFNASLRCLSKNGHFIEIGKREFLLNSSIQAEIFLKGVTLYAISLDDIIQSGIQGQYRSTKEKMLQIFEDHLKRGLIRPIPRRRLFEVEQISEALKSMQNSDHVGKIILRVRKDDISVLAPPKIYATLPRVYFKPNKSYIIIGGLGGLGVELALILTLRGAKHIFLNSRSKPRNGFQLDFIKTAEVWGTNIYLNHDDTSNFENAEKLFIQANSLKPLGGLFNLAMVNRDASLENLSVDDFREVFKPKVSITKNFDKLTRDSGLEIDYFVVYSSITCGKGNLGQTNYGYANSCLERIIEKRNDDGLPGLAIQWGPMADVGYFAKTSTKQELGHYIAQPVTSYFEVLQEFLLNKSGILASSLVKNVFQTIQVGDSLLESVLKLFGIPSADKLSDETTLLELGMDSLMGFEIKQYLYREHDIDITVPELRSKTIKEIKKIDEKRKDKK